MQLLIITLRLNLSTDTYSQSDAKYLLKEIVQTQRCKLWRSSFCQVLHWPQHPPKLHATQVALPWQSTRYSSVTVNLGEFTQEPELKTPKGAPKVQWDAVDPIVPSLASPKVPGIRMNGRKIWV